MAIKRNYILVLSLIFVLFFVFSCSLPTYSTDIAFAEEGDAVASSVGDSQTVEFVAYPLESCQDCTWELTIDEDKMTSWLTNRVKEKDINDYIQLTIDGNKCTVTALQYFKYGIKYTTYYTLTATSIQNPELSATCSIKLG